MLNVLQVAADSIIAIVTCATCSPSRPDALGSSSCSMASVNAGPATCRADWCSSAWAQWVFACTRASLEQPPTQGDPEKIVEDDPPVTASTAWHRSSHQAF